MTECPADFLDTLSFTSGRKHSIVMKTKDVPVLVAKVFDWVTYWSQIVMTDTGHGEMPPK